ncbi:DUF4297 domain-containing protein [Mucilaginibacter sp. ZT4R22]|uniref:DUF4297 domain-containing protein n=1 Tax=Mucilaginibacter pankratovii TaxID=2772110 RepID=A0ABR7WSU4_9SPHI|nr:dsDNA nuclease domain-containing protein [Mucilaginibacter pankratovii]MBD1365384.1 DUF4297 domain-containing protein [Mucilaginibacter pankratovii]
MSTNLLNLFSKATDATATEQGFHYQKLKTLKTWLENRIAGKDELIFCDTDDDIVQRDTAAGATKFRQVKLYSTNFSFSTDEVTKSLANFFMLYTQGEYLFEEVVFAFETNAGIAKETRGNDADLLREWAEHQGDLSDELLERCVTRVKQILDPYIADGYAKEKAKDHEGLFLKAKNLYERLPDDFWRSFVKSVRWEFDVIPRDTAIPQLTAEIAQLIGQLPLPVNTKQVSSYIADLHWEIVQRTIDKDPERRVLSNGLLDYLILHHGDKESHWYAALFDKWSADPKVGRFHVGSFLEVVSATRHCRWNLIETGHAPLWLEVMQQFIRLPDIPIPFKRKAIYEYLFLKMQAARAKGEADASMAADAPLVVEYFEHLEERHELADIEEDISFLQIVTAESKITEGFADDAAIEAWTEKLRSSINTHLNNARDVNEHCLMLEMKGTALMSLRHGMHDIEKVKAAMDIFRQIVPLLPSANHYTISLLSELLKQMADVYRLLGEKFENMVDEIERFRLEIAMAAPETDRRLKAAKDLVQSGATLLAAGGTRNFLRALTIFHKVVEVWRMQETMDAHVLALLGIGQVYHALGANFAGKYYALCAIWSAWHTGDEKVMAKLGDCYGMVFHADYLQGAWFSALGEYLPYMNYQKELKNGGHLTDDRVIKNFLDLVLILESAEKVHPDLVHLINDYKTRLGDLYTKEMAYLVEPLQAHLKATEDHRSFVVERVMDAPFNDAGAERFIRFKMLGPTWEIRFQNDHVMTAIAEEFAAVLQVILCEIGRSGKDIALPEKTICINIEQCDGQMEWPVLEGEIWTLRIPAADKHEPGTIRMHYAGVGNHVRSILSEISLLPKDEVETFYLSLLKERQMGQKALSVTSYQRAYFQAMDEEIFDLLARRHFSQVPGRFDHPLIDTLAVTA